MTERSVRHAKFTIERIYPAARERVFKAFADPRSKAKWFVGPDDWEKSNHALDFRVGGKETVSGGPPGGQVHYYNSTFQDIVPNERIVTTYEMHLDKTRISVSLATVEFKAAGSSTRLILTEQGAFLDGFDKPELREEGTKGLLDQLGAALGKGIV
jgi:uncharacterized protein YndB with AHSA1/START domain